MNKVRVEIIPNSLLFQHSHTKWANHHDAFAYLQNNSTTSCIERSTFLRTCVYHFDMSEGNVAGRSKIHLFKTINYSTEPFDRHESLAVKLKLQNL